MYLQKKNAEMLTEYSIHTSKPLRLAFCLGKSLKVILFYACFLSLLYLVKGCYGVAEALVGKRKLSLTILTNVWQEFSW